MPTYLAILVAVTTPLLAFGGTLFGVWLTRRGAVELDTWRRREETMRMLRWSAEMAARSDEASRLVGVATLDALRFSELLQPADYGLVDAVTEAVLGGTLEEIGDDLEAVVVEEDE